MTGKTFERITMNEHFSCLLDFPHIDGETTEMRFNLCTWLGEISSCPCLTVLLGPAWVLLNKICKD